MIDTQRLGALLRALIREDAVTARLRTPAAAPLRPAAGIGPELPQPLLDKTLPVARDGARPDDPTHARDPARPREPVNARAADTPRLPGRLLGDLPGATSETPTRGALSSTVTLTTRATAMDGAVPGAALTQDAPRSAALQLSDTGRLLLAALRIDAPQAGATPVPGSAMQPLSGSLPDGLRGAQPQALGARAPLIAVPPHSEVATDRLALQLKDAVEYSGLFYEAHLAQWADDMRPRALLAHEPQSRWPVATEIAQRVVAADAAPADFATPLLRQQLDVLETGRFVWQGELWPGQPGTLVIEEEEPPPQRAGILDEPLAPRWRMRLSLSFPQLGTIDASVALAGESVDFDLHCDDPAAVAQLRSAAPALRLAIAERALDLANLTVAHDSAA